ncbi:polymer-forming cytoskeletal protein [Christensenella timonensis]|uniref:polymer-forming cytoskeletal protein n=1 Tax=Christensenella timonensis TaxID=1816678 RepID=UPI00082D5B1C|nr:polymer-forming cytoskeletal protein [Christensenella timonensis]
MNGFTINGVGTIDGGQFSTLKIDGTGRCTGDLEAESIEVDGTFKCEGNVKTGLFDCDGSAKLHGNLEAKKIDVDGLLSVKSGKIEAEEIDCDGLIDVGGEVSADIIQADGYIRAKEIVGDRVSIKSHMGRLVKVLNKKSEIGMIEATTVDLEGVWANTVNGRDITIGPRCEIKTVDCNGTLYIDEKATVGEITGNFQRRG